MRIPVLFNKKNNRLYWLSVLFPIILYSFMEGTRWKRGVDYMYNFRIANIIVKSHDFLYDTYALLLNKMGISWIFFFVTISFLLIWSIILYAKLYHKAFLPMTILVYAFTMQQSENLMRQYTAISLVLIALYFFHRRGYFYVVIFSFFAYFTHSSSLFVIPFVLVAFFCLKYNHKYIFIKYFYVFFFVLYMIAPFLSNLLANHIAEVFSYMNVGMSAKYLDSEYVDKAIDITGKTTAFKAYATDSILDYIRSNIRNSVVILLGGYFLTKRLAVFDVIKKVRKSNNLLLEKYKEQNSFMYISWFLACCGIIYLRILPDFDMEVMYRLSLYLYIFVYYIEGVLVYIYIKKRKGRKYIYFKLLMILLIIIECIWVFKWNNGATCGLKFIWLK